MRRSTLNICSCISSRACHKLLRFSRLCAPGCAPPPLSGAKKREEIYTAFENIYPTLKEYKKKEAAEAAGLGALAPKPTGAGDDCTLCVNRE